MKSFLAHHGFHRHPFGSWIAEDEATLSGWFVPPPFLENLLGIRDGVEHLKPVSTVVFGEPGIGKTAIRRMMEAELNSLAPMDLVIPYTDFTNPLSRAGTEPPSVVEHVDEILLLGSIALIRFWVEDASRYDRLDSIKKSELAGLVFQYYSELPASERDRYTHDLSPRITRLTRIAARSGKKLVELYNTVINVLERDKIEPVDWGRGARKHDNPFLALLRFWELAHAMGATGIRVLVDRIDEASGVSTPAEIIDCIRHLILSQQLMEFREGDRQVLGVTVFLSHPSRLVPILDESGFRRDRVAVEHIRWNRPDLEAAMVRRLEHFSNGRVSSFSAMCEPELGNTQDRLLQASGLRPRTLFRMGAEILKAFQRSGRSGEWMLNESDVENGIRAGQIAVFG